MEDSVWWGNKDLDQVAPRQPEDMPKTDVIQPNGSGRASQRQECLSQI